MNAPVHLSDNTTIPEIGFGTWKLPSGEAHTIVRTTIEVGYRHLDCAADYGNEESVGRGINEAINDGLTKREDLWVTSKLWNTCHAAEHVQLACERSLRDLGLDYLDLYLIHFPIALKFVPFDERYPAGWLHDEDATDPKMELVNVSIAETWAAMESLKQSGLVRHIGISNFNIALIRDLQGHASIQPEVLQVELHPYLSQPKLVRFCKENDIAVCAFSPLGAPSYVPLGMAEDQESAMTEQTIMDIAADVDATPAQVILKWGMQRGCCVIPKSQNPDRIKQNFDSQHLTLTADQMDAISSLNCGRRFNDPGDFCEEAFNTFCPIFD